MKGPNTVEHNSQSYTYLRKKFEAYLTMIFADLCAKDNGTAYKSFGLNTFIKVRLIISILIT